MAKSSNVQKLSDFYKSNFGTFLLAIIVMIVAYSALSVWEPQYAATFAMVTLLGIVIFWLNK